MPLYNPNVPAGATQQVQFNDAGQFGVDAAFTYDKTTDRLTVGALTVDTTKLFVDVANSRVGMNTASPSNGLTLQQTADSQNTDGFAVYRANGTSRSVYFQGGDDNLYFFNYGAGLEFYVSGATRAFSLDGSGNAQVVNGKLGVGIAPSTKLHVSSADNQTNTTLHIAATQANITSADKFMSFASNSGEEGSVVGTGVAGVIAYTTFTAAHKTMVQGSPDLMALLEMTGTLCTRQEFNQRGRTQPSRTEKTLLGDVEIPARYEGPAPKEFLPTTKVCVTRGSNACYGVFAGYDEHGMALALSMGTGWIRVANKGKNLEVGDFLISSDTAGCAELQLQDRDLKKRSTIAQVSENVAWAADELSRVVACRYLMG